MKRYDLTKNKADLWLINKGLYLFIIAIIIGLFVMMLYAKSIYWFVSISVLTIAFILSYIGRKKGVQYIEIDDKNKRIKICLQNDTIIDKHFDEVYYTVGGVYNISAPMAIFWKDDYCNFSYEINNYHELLDYIKRNIRRKGQKSISPEPTPRAILLKKIFLIAITVFLCGMAIWGAVFVFTDRSLLLRWGIIVLSIFMGSLLTWAYYKSNKNI